MNRSDCSSPILENVSLADRQLLSLLRSALSGSPPDEGLFEKPVDWAALLRSALRQTVVAVAFDGMERLPRSLRPPRETLLAWYGMVRQVERGNQRVNELLSEAFGRYAAAGLRPVLLKGQGLARHYPVPQHRQPGDIDFFFGAACGAANDAARSWEGARFHPATAYHQSFEWRGVEIENHSRYVDFYHPANRRAWRDIEARLPLAGGDVLPCEGGGVPVPAAQMNALYVLLHLLHHFFQVGVGLRQLCDWHCLLRARRQEIDMGLLGDCTARLRVRRPAAALACVAEECLGLERGTLPFDTGARQARRDARLMLEDMLRTGNFGHDTAIMRNFRRGRHLHNWQSYLRAAARFQRIRRLCPAEVDAYFLSWLRDKVKR